MLLEIFFFFFFLKVYMADGLLPPGWSDRDGWKGPELQSNVIKSVPFWPEWPEYFVPKPRKDPLPFVAVVVNGEGLKLEELRPGFLTMKQK